MKAENADARTTKAEMIGESEIVGEYEALAWHSINSL
jgi:hypothetical protein